MSSVKSPIIVALDYPHADAALTLVDQLDPLLCRVKVGKELFTREGPAIIKAIQSRGFELFLDLKFHDIPNTVASAVHAAADLGVWMVNVHASGGRRMMTAARERLQQNNLQTLLIAVTVLTSSERTDLAEIGLDIDPIEQVQRLAKLTADCGLDGVVCSAQEATVLRQQYSQSFSLITPGIRPVGSDNNDQKRIMTPKQAVDVGVDYMVIGRPITQAPKPIEALRSILSSLS